MAFRPFSVTTADNGELKWLLHYLSILGYGSHDPSFVDYWMPDRYDEWFNVYVWGPSGSEINTASTASLARRRIGSTGLMFPSLRAFLLSNANVDTDGKPRAHEFA